MMGQSQDDTRYFFIDETGDPHLFRRNKKPVRLGEGGASKFFMIGVAMFADLADAENKLNELKRDLLADPTLANIPSIEKTKRLFHAKDDFPAVKRDVFRIMQNINFNMNVIIRRKSYLIDGAISRQKVSGEKITDREIYHDMIERLLERSQHTASRNEFIFAKRGKTFTTNSLKMALAEARSNFEKTTGIKGHDNHVIKAEKPESHIGLQVVDYALWALQRLYERHEDYYFNKVANKFSLVMDIDDKRHKEYGSWYTRQNNKLSLEKIKGIS